MADGTEGCGRLGTSTAKRQMVQSVSSSPRPAFEDTLAEGFAHCRSGGVRELRIPSQVKPLDSEIAEENAPRLEKNLTNSSLSSIGGALKTAQSTGIWRVN